MPRGRVVSAPPQVARARRLRPEIGNHLARNGANPLEGFFALGGFEEWEAQLSEPRASRNGFINPFGKMGKAINGLTLPVDVEEELRARAAHTGIPFLELLRELIVITAKGRDAVDATLRARLDAIEGKQQE